VCAFEDVIVESASQVVRNDLVVYQPVNAASAHFSKVKSWAKIRSDISCANSCMKTVLLVDAVDFALFACIGVFT
jgi:hypothetical protein